MAPSAGTIRHHQERQDGKQKIRLSVSSSGNCYNHAAAGRFFAMLKVAAVQGQVYASRQAARQALFACIEVFYNHHRLHSGAGYTCPITRTA